MELLQTKAKQAGTRRLWQVWYYISLAIGAWAFFLVLTNSPCFGETSQRCASYAKASDIFVTASAAFANLVFARWKYKGVALPKISLWTTWRGDRTLPPSFALFVMMAAVFIGEVMPVVVSIIVGAFGAYGAKEPIIGSLPDFGLILIIYSALGTLFWVLYRCINWRIVAAFAFVLTFILERYVYWHPEGEISVANTISIGTILGGIIVYTLVLVLPYFVFQRIRSKQGKNAVKKMLVAILALNIIGLGFTYAYMLNTGWYEKDHANLIRPGESEQYADLSMITPYVNESDVSRIGPFGSDGNNPWGFKHDGVDFFAERTVPFRAVADGTVEMVSTSKENEQQGWHTALCINHRPFLVCYNFETFSPDEAAGQRQSDSILVKNGDRVKQGDLIGRLVRGGDGAHVDLGVLQAGSGERVCPEPSFTEEARESILRLIHKDHPDWMMCY